MKKQHILVIVLLWAVLTAAAWFAPPKEMSDSERRPLAQMPEVSMDALSGGKFMSEFEKYALDQFPLRDGFRTLKSLFHQYILLQGDNNGIYLHKGYAAKQEYPLNKDSVNHAMERLNHIYNQYLTESDVYMAVIPDKGYYLAEDAGQLAMDYEALFAMVEAAVPWAEHISLTGSLALEDYYRTDTHWRQEQLLETAGVISQAMGIPAPVAGEYTATALERPFYGVYYGQAALPMEPETMYLLESDLLAGCTVYDYETGRSGAVYDLTKLDSRDLYDVYLSGARALLTVENPRTETDRELIVFRDSFGSSLVPLLVQGYARVTLVDIRYVSSNLLDQYLDFHGQDVLMLYSTLILNGSSAMK